VAAAAADLADEVSFHNVSMRLLADRLGVRTPSLYKHVTGLAEVRHRVAVLAVSQLGDAVRDAVGGRAGRDALAALATAFRDFVTGHPGRYAATVGAEFTGPDDPLLAASIRVLDAIAAVLTGYGIPADTMDHALRVMRSTFYGFATLQAANAFTWTGDPDDSFHWMIEFVDRGLRP
jgi:AcrR family transcriptional regulator